MKDLFVIVKICCTWVQDSDVPQGTVLGPLMFLLYINDIGNDITSKIRLFADDSLLYAHFPGLVQAL